MIILLGFLVGTLAWEIVERLVALTGRAMELSIGPIGFDVRAVSVWIRVNPGSFLGTVSALLLLQRL